MYSTSLSIVFWQNKLESWETQTNLTYIPNTLENTGSHCAHTGWINIVSTSFQWNYPKPMWNRRWIDVCCQWVVTRPDRDMKKFFSWMVWDSKDSYVTSFSPCSLALATIDENFVLLRITKRNNMEKWGHNQPHLLGIYALTKYFFKCVLQVRNHFLWSACLGVEIEMSVSHQSNFFLALPLRNHIWHYYFVNTVTLSHSGGFPG